MPIKKPGLAVIMIVAVTASAHPVHAEWKLAVRPSPKERETSPVLEATTAESYRGEAECRAAMANARQAHPDRGYRCLHQVYSVYREVGEEPFSRLVPLTPPSPEFETEEECRATVSAKNQRCIAKGVLPPRRDPGRGARTERAR
jgi:hypothetical protein